MVGELQHHLCTFRRKCRDVLDDFGLNHIQLIDVSKIGQGVVDDCLDGREQWNLNLDGSWLEGVDYVRVVD